MKYRVKEIFNSIQGEGANTGQVMTFIRFAGCNLRCNFCDTDFKERMQLTMEEILQEVKKYNCNNLLLTGGEPTLQITPDFCRYFREAGYRLYLETNGTTETVYSDIYWITVSPKENWKRKKGQEIKVIYTGQDLKQYDDKDFIFYYLQPCSMNNINETIQAVKGNPKWRLSLQIHKLLNIA